MNPSIAIVSAAVTVFALALSVFGASWLNQRNTKMLVENLGQRLDQRIDSLEKRFDQHLDSMDQRLDRIERQLETIFKPSLPK
jgi:Tfp pilus assembly protein PilN